MRTGITLALLLLLGGCASSTAWGWYVIDPRTASGWANIRFLVGGMWATILISVMRRSCRSCWA